MIVSFEREIKDAWVKEKGCWTTLYTAFRAGYVIGKCTEERRLMAAIKSLEARR